MEISSSPEPSHSGEFSPSSRQRFSPLAPQPRRYLSQNAQHSTRQHSDAQHSDTQDPDTQHSDTEHSAPQRSAHSPEPSDTEHSASQRSAPSPEPQEPEPSAHQPLSPTAPQPHSSSATQPHSSSAPQLISHSATEAADSSGPQALSRSVAQPYSRQTSFPGLALDGLSRLRAEGLSEAPGARPRGAESLADGQGLSLEAVAAGVRELEKDLDKILDRGVEGDKLAEKDRQTDREVPSGGSLLSPPQRRRVSFEGSSIEGEDGDTGAKRVSFSTTGAHSSTGVESNPNSDSNADRGASTIDVAVDVWEDSNPPLETHVPDEEKLDWMAFLDNQYRISTRESGHELDTRMKEVSNDLSMTPVFLYGPSPLLGLLRARLFKVTLCVLSLLYFALFVWISAVLLVDETHQAQRIRVHMLELRGEEWRPAQFEVKELGLQLHSCQVPDGEVVRDGEWVEVTYAEPKQFTGWWLRTGLGDPELDPIRVEVETFRCLDGCEGEAMSHWKLGMSIPAKRASVWRIGPPRERDTLITFESRPAWYWTFGELTSLLGLSLGFIAAFSLARQQHLMRAKLVLSVTLVFLLLVSVLVLVISHAGGQVPGILRWWGTLLSFLLLIPCVSFHHLEKFLVQMLVISGLCYQLFMGLEFWLIKDSSFEFFEFHGFYWSIAAEVLGCALTIHRERMLRQVMKDIEEDRVDFDTVWNELHDDPLFVAQMPEFLANVASFNRRLQKRPVQRLTNVSVSGDNPRFLFVKSMSNGWLQRVGSTRKKTDGALVKSLNQLYTQAEGASRLMKHKVMYWAAGSNGLLACSAKKETRGAARQNFIPASELRRDEELYSLINWTGLKPYARAIEKVLRHYHGDVSKLIDVVRETIVFERVKDIVACLTRMTGDQDIVVCKVKNSIDPSAEAFYTAGFRFVIVNFRFVAPVARTLGFDGHVCELMLLLKPFAESLSETSHRDYLRLRELRDAEAVTPVKLFRGIVSHVKKRVVNETPAEAQLDPSTTQTCPKLNCPPGPKVEVADNQAIGRDHSTYFVRATSAEQRSQDSADALNQEEKEARYEFLKGQYRQRTIQAAGYLDKKKMDIEMAVANVHNFSVFEGSHPIAAALCKPWFPTMFLLLGVVFAAIVGMDINEGLTAGRSTGSTIRFRALELRDSSVEMPSFPVIQSLGLLRKGCQLDLQIQSQHQSALEYTIELLEEVEFDGFWFETGNVSEFDPTVFVLEASKDGMEFEVVGTSRRIITSDFHITWINKPFDTPDERGEKVEIDFRMRSIHFVSTIGLSFTLMITCFVLGLCGMNRKARNARMGRPVLVTGFSIGMMVLFIHAVVATIEKSYVGFPLQWLDVLVCLIAALVLHYGEKYLIEVMLGSGMAFLVTSILEDAVTEKITLERTSRYDAMCLTIFGIMLVVLRKYARVSSANKIQEDQHQYHHVWENMLNDEKEKAGLDRIETLTSMLPPMPTHGHLIQRFRNAAAEKRAGRGTWFKRALRNQLNHYDKHGKRVGRTGSFDRAGSNGSVSRIGSTLDNFSRAGSTGFSRAGSNDTAGRRSNPQSPSAGKMLSKTGSGLFKWGVSGRAPGIATPDGNSPSAFRNRSPAARRGSAPPAPQTPPATPPAPAPPAHQPRQEADPGALSPATLNGFSSDPAEGSVPSRASNNPGDSSSTLCTGPPISHTHSAPVSPVAKGSRRIGSGLAARLAVLKKSTSILRTRSQKVPAHLSEPSSMSLPHRSKSWSSKGIVRRAGSLGRSTSWIWHNIKNFHLTHHHSAEDEKDTPPVKSLDQLYAQGAGLFPILKEKVQRWAAASGGCFSVEVGKARHCMKWEETRDNQWLQSKIKWATLKSYQRAIEKLVRSYDGRVERLLDICRQTIIFETADELADCIEQIQYDPDISICAVKNRLSPSYDSKHSVGYRDVHINMRIVTSDTEHLGLDLHIVEVLLLLRPFADVKSEAGHKRYVMFRNARGL